MALYGRWDVRQSGQVYLQCRDCWSIRAHSFQLACMLLLSTCNFLACLLLAKGRTLQIPKLVLRYNFLAVPFVRERAVFHARKMSRAVPRVAMSRSSADRVNGQ